MQLSVFSSWHRRTTVQLHAQEAQKPALRCVWFVDEIFRTKHQRRVREGPDPVAQEWLIESTNNLVGRDGTGWDLVGRNGS